MSVAADVVRGVLCVGAIGGMYAVVVRLPMFVAFCCGLVMPVASWCGKFAALMLRLFGTVVVDVRLWFGTMVLCVGLWFLRFGSRVADIHISLSFPEVTHE